MTFEDLPGLTVTVDNVAYDPTRPAPPDRPHPFVYHISIHNGSEDTVNIFGRKWIVRDTDGRRRRRSRGPVSQAVAGRILQLQQLPRDQGG